MITVLVFTGYIVVGVVLISIGARIQPWILEATDYDGYVTGKVDYAGVALMVVLWPLMVIASAVLLVGYLIGRSVEALSGGK